MKLHVYILKGGPVGASDMSDLVNTCTFHEIILEHLFLPICIVLDLFYSSWNEYPATSLSSQCAAKHFEGSFPNPFNWKNIANTFKWFHSHFYFLYVLFAHALFECTCDFSQYATCSILLPFFVHRSQWVESKNEFHFYFSKITKIAKTKFIH